MNSLLKRQLRKHLTKDVSALDPNVQELLRVIDASYKNFDEQIKMGQRAMNLSSNELFDHNKRLRAETKLQEKIINSLNDILDRVNPKNEKTEINEDHVSIIESQALKIKEIYTDLEDRNKELEDYAKAVSHDLKSPLRNIYSLVSWLIEDLDFKISKENTETITLIYENLENMESLINGILAYSTIAKSHLDSEFVNLKELIVEILKSLDVPKHINITFNNKLPVYLGNKFRLRQVFQNLITNAIKYNDKEIGLINIDFIEKSDVLQISISDNGVGIKKRQHQKIFEMFYKIESKKRASGIGLSIVKKIINLYGGTIWIESEYKKGSTFYFTLKKQFFFGEA